MKITVEPYHDKHVIYADSYGVIAAAGPRLFRAPPHPNIKFGYYNERIEAEKDAQKLRAYLDQLPAKKISKEKLRNYRE